MGQWTSGDVDAAGINGMTNLRQTVIELFLLIKINRTHMASALTEADQTYDASDPCRELKGTSSRAKSNFERVGLCQENGPTYTSSPKYSSK